MKRIANAIVFSLFTYPAGLVIGVIFSLLKSVGILDIKNPENFPKHIGKILLVSNHPSKVESILLIGLFFKQYILHPFKSSPWVLADKKNYYDNWKFFLMRPRLIPVDRDGEKGDSSSILQARSKIQDGANIIMFPEGGRSFKGRGHSVSKSGKILRPLKGGFTVLAVEKGVLLVPVWFEFHSWTSMKIKIGKPVYFEGSTKEEVLELTTQILLDLADETN